MEVAPTKLHFPAYFGLYKIVSARLPIPTSARFRQSTYKMSMAGLDRNSIPLFAISMAVIMLIESDRTRLGPYHYEIQALLWTIASQFYSLHTKLGWHFGGLIALTGAGFNVDRLVSDYTDFQQPVDLSSHGPWLRAAACTALAISISAGSAWVAYCRDPIPPQMAEEMEAAKKKAAAAKT